MESISECSPLGARLAESPFIPRHAHFASFCASSPKPHTGMPFACFMTFMTLERMYGAAVITNDVPAALMTT